MKLNLKIGLSVFLLFLVYLATECICWIFIKGHYGYYPLNVTKFYQDKMPSTYYKAQENLEDFYYLSPHPYYGFIQNKSLIGPVNNYGFSESKSFPIQKKDGQFILGIFGGELAQELGLYWEHNPEIKNKILQSFKLPIIPDELVLLNLALPGSKEPQNFYIFSHFLYQLDAAIFIEGHNEIFYEDMLTAPLEYPWNYTWYFPSPHNKETSSKFYHRLMNYIRVQGYLTKLPLDYTFLQKSGVYFVIWKNAMNYLENLKIRIENRVGSKWPPSFSHSQILNSKLEIWKKYLKKNKALANFRKIPYYVFLPPNVYLPNSKSLTEDEKYIAINPSDQKTKSEDYQTLVSKIHEWKSQGITIIDLTNIFSQEKERLFADDVSGLNEKGTMKLGNAILEFIEQTNSTPVNPSSQKKKRGKHLRK